MTYANAQYINVARASEMQHHEYTMEQLQAKITQLTKAVTWELTQHQARLKELQQVEESLNAPTPSKPLRTHQPTLDPLPSSKSRWIQLRKYVRRALHKPAAQLVA